MENFETELRAMIRAFISDAVTQPPEDESEICDALDLVMKICTEELLRVESIYTGWARPASFYQVGADFGVEMLSRAIAAGLYEAETHAAEFVGKLSPEARTHVFFQLLGACFTPDEGGELTREGKRMLLDLTEVMGSDYAQGLYRFAVRYTKLV